MVSEKEQDAHEKEQLKQEIMVIEEKMQALKAEKQQVNSRRVSHPLRLLAGLGKTPYRVDEMDSDPPAKAISVTEKAIGKIPPKKRLMKKVGNELVLARGPDQSKIRKFGEDEAEEDNNEYEDEEDEIPSLNLTDILTQVGIEVVD